MVNKLKESIQVFAQNAILLSGTYRIYIDPFQIPDKFMDADFIFITHPHWDHFSLLDVLKVRNAETRFLVPKEIFEELLDIGISEEQICIVKPNQNYQFDRLGVKTFPAYNLKKNHHLKEKEWVGYYIAMDDVTYYVAGDTDAIPEVKQVKADVVFLPVGGTYTMNYIEAATLANHIKPHLAIPTHYLSVVGSLDDAKRFCKRVNMGIDTNIFYDKKGD